MTDARLSAEIAATLRNGRRCPHCNAAPLIFRGDREVSRDEKLIHIELTYDCRDGCGKPSMYHITQAHCR
jgi:hypothetical protein